MLLYVFDTISKKFKEIALHHCTVCLLVLLAHTSRDFEREKRKEW